MAAQRDQTCLEGFECSPAAAPALVFIFCNVLLMLSSLPFRCVDFLLQIFRMHCHKVPTCTQQKTALLCVHH